MAERTLADASLEQLVAGGRKAKADGATQAQKELFTELESRQDGQAWIYDKAIAAGDIDTADKYAKKYREGFGELNDDNAATNHLWVKNSAALFEENEGKPFEGTAEDVAAYGFDQVRDLEWATIPQGKQLIDWANDNISDRKGMALIGLTEMHDDDVPMSWKGTGEALKRVVDPTESPDTYVGLGIGGLARRAVTGVAKKAAMSGLRKHLFKKARTAFGEKVAATAASELAQKGAVKGVKGRSLRLAKDAAMAAPEAAFMGGVGGAVDQSIENPQGDLDVGRLAGAAVTGGITGGLMGAGTGAALRTAAKGVPLVKSNAAKVAQGDAAVAGAEAMGERGSGGMLEKAYAEVAETTPNMDSPAAASQVFDRAMVDPIVAHRGAQTELRELVKDGAITDDGLTRAREQLKLSRQGSEATTGLDMSTLGVKPENQLRVQEAIHALEDTGGQVAELIKQRGSIFGEASVPEQLLNDPSVNVMADMLPGGYVATRAGGRMFKMFRTRKTGKTLRSMIEEGRGAESTGKRVGPATGAEVGVAKQAHALDYPEMMDSLARRASARQAVKVERKAAKEAKAAARTPAGKAAAQRAKMDDAISRKEKWKVGQKTNHGGIQGSWAVDFKLAKPDVNKALTAIEKDLTDPAMIAEVQDFRKLYNANVNTKKHLDGDAYYDIQEAIRKRARPMSDEAYASFLPNAVREPGKIGKKAEKRLKKLEKDKKEGKLARTAVAKAQAKATKKTTAAGKKAAALDTIRSNQDALHENMDAKIAEQAVKIRQLLGK